MQKAEGLGDTIEIITKATGIKSVVETISKGLNIPCKCKYRKKKLNEIFPYK